VVEVWWQTGLVYSWLVEVRSGTGEAGNDAVRAVEVGVV
jgi:hypothetical protein